MPLSSQTKSAEKEIQLTTYLNRSDKKRVLEFWNTEFPKRLNFTHEDDFDKYLESLDIHNHYLVKSPNNELLAWSMVFDRDNETWFAMIVNEPHQFQGIGKTLMSAMKKRTTQLNGWLVDHNNDIKSNGENYLSKKDYYLKHDFKILDHSRLETQQISAVQIQWEKA